MKHPQLLIAAIQVLGGLLGWLAASGRLALAIAQDTRAQPKAVGSRVALPTHAAGKRGRAHAVRIDDRLAVYDKAPF